MDRRYLLKGALLVGAYLSLASPVLGASPLEADAMPLGHPTVSPAGFRAYCQAAPQNCLNASRQPVDRSLPVRSNRRSAAATGGWADAFAQARDERDVSTGAVYGAAQAPGAAIAAMNGQSFPAGPSGLWRTAFSQARGERDALATYETRNPRTHPGRSAWAVVSTRHGSDVPLSKRQTALVVDAPREIVMMNRSTEALLQTVNTSVNRTIRASRDEILYGADVWGARLGSDGFYYGDCEDYALAKRELLISRGIPANALSLAVARTRAGDTHAVLVVTTERGDYVLDNLSYWVRPWREVDYRWIARQNEGQAGDWRAIEPETNQLASMGNPRDRRRY